MDKVEPMRFAHRGVVRRAPENTLDAIEAAYELGCEGVEVDIRRTRDERIVLFHDESVERVVSGGPDDGDDRLVADLRWEEIRGLSLPYANHLLPDLPSEGIAEAELYPRILERQLGREPDHPHSHERSRDPRITHPPLFEELLAWALCRPRSLVIEVECKEIGLAAGLRVLFERFGGAQRCILFSGEPEVVEELAAEFPAGPGERRRPDGPRIGANIRRLSRGMWSDIERLCLDVIDLNAFECERGELDELHRGGFEVLSNLGDLPDWWQVIRDWGFDGFKTNYPEEYTAWRQLPARRS